MNITTLVFFILVSFFVWRGYRKGFIASVTRILSWLIAYPAAIFFTKPLANLLMQHTHFDGVLVYMLAGCSIFFVVSLLVGLILNLIARATPTNSFTAAGSRFGGATVGLLIGGVLGLLAVYAIDLVKSPRSQTVVATTEKNATGHNTQGKQEELFDNHFSPEDESFIEHSAKKLVSTAASTAVGITLDNQAASQMTKAFAQDPQTMLDHVQQLTNDGQVKQLLAKPEFQAQLNQGNINNLMQNQDFKQLLDNPDMRAIMATGDNEQASQEAAQKMVAAWQKVDVLKNDPRVLAILNDDAFQQQLNSTNKLQLMMNPKLRELTEIIFNSDSPAQAQTQTQTQATATSQKITRYSVEDLDTTTPQHPAIKNTNSHANQSEASEHKIYRWTDAEGKVHFSDKPVKD